MNKNELRKLMTKANTIAGARKKVQEQAKYWGYDNTEIYVRCYSCISWGTTFSTDLYVELTNGDDWETITVASIEIDTEQEDSKYFGMDIDLDKFEEITWDIFKTMKNNMIKELKTYNYEIAGTEDYHM